MSNPLPELSQVGNVVAQPQGLQREVAHLLGRSNTSFPGAQPVSFCRKHLQDLKQRDYFLCEKSDGIRCLLYFAKGEISPETGAPIEAHWLIDRKNNYYYVNRLHFPYPGATPDEDPIWPSFHIDTLLDGELLWDSYYIDALGPMGQPILDAAGKPQKTIQRKLKYLVFDCLVLDGSNLCPKLLDKRLAHFYSGVLAPYKALCKRFPEDTQHFPFILEQKSMERAYGIAMMFKDIIPNLKHTSDGLIFTCKETPYQSGTDENIVKWKPAHENSVDFKLDLEFPPIPADELADEDSQYASANTNGAPKIPALDYDAIPKARLHIYGGDQTQPDVYCSDLIPTPSEWERMKSYALSHQTGLDGLITECHKDEDGKWRFMKFRTDKAEANHTSTVTKVMQSIDDAVTEEDLYAAAPGIRTGWKEREAIMNRRIEEERAEAERRHRARAAEVERVEMERRRKIRPLEMQQLQQQQQQTSSDQGLLAPQTVPLPQQPHSSGDGGSPAPQTAQLPQQPKSGSSETGTTAVEQEQRQKEPQLTSPETTHARPLLKEQGCQERQESGPLEPQQNGNHWSETGGKDHAF